MFSGPGGGVTIAESLGSVGDAAQRSHDAQRDRRGYERRDGCGDQRADRDRAAQGIAYVHLRLGKFAGNERDLCGADLYAVDDHGRGAGRAVGVGRHLGHVAHRVAQLERCPPVVDHGQ